MESFGIKSLIILLLLEEIPRTLSITLQEVTFT